MDRKSQDQKIEKPSIPIIIPAPVIKEVVPIVTEEEAMNLLFSIRDFNPTPVSTVDVDSSLKYWTNVASRYKRQAIVE